MNIPKNCRYCCHHLVYEGRPRLVSTVCTLHKFDYDAPKCTQPSYMAGGFSAVHESCEPDRAIFLSTRPHWCPLTENDAIERNEIDGLKTQRDQLLAALERLIDDINGLMNESSGVYGLHLNGAVATWEELAGAWLSGIGVAEAAIASVRKDSNKDGAAV